ncbi:UvrABC system protein B [archaeon HR06]|nr:UvrABC system protein B [archaeon HR06]
MISIIYDRGSLLIRGLYYIPFTIYDPRVKALRAEPIYYKDIIEYLKRSRLNFEDKVFEDLPFPYISLNLKLRDYQREALEAWKKANRRGVIVLPTGAGKTLIGIKAIEEVKKPSLIVVPTIDLLNQWKDKLEELLDLEIGIIGGGEFKIKPITVCTYDSAYIKAELLGNKFYLLIFDECHHLASLGYRQIAEISAAPYRLGLTATLEREDGLHLDIPKLIGGKVYELKPSDLAGKYLAEYEIKRIKLELLPDEEEEYEKNWKIYTDYLNKKGLNMKGIEDFKRFLMVASKDREGREALLARNRALKIALNSRAKLEKLKEILKEKDDKTIIFTQHNELVHRISKEFLIPFITHKTSKEERREILKGFREGRYLRIVTSKVLDEGVDVPDASLGIILSGTGSSREFVQRLGRLLRPKGDKKALLIEIVSKGTKEVEFSRKRKRILDAPTRTISS